MPAKISFSTGLAATIALAGCQDYRVSLNDRPVYQPPGMVRDIQAQDPALNACIAQWISDQNITQHRQLNALNCSHAGISDITGLNQFTGLQQVNLADNQIQSIEGLLGLSQITRLDLSGNNLTQLQTLLNLPRLEWVDLRGNKGVRCDEVGQMTAGGDVEVEAPNHCNAR
ncbi:hypothetical protein [Halioxenophilus aromaticivorans]|uniref:Leucine-rich repeat domain-containing protein n=1 Tax=Halioxenophilus aromaticivorans TaxID=1306992 RepID=A0AAV3TZ51_9ALTE